MDLSELVIFGMILTVVGIIGLTFWIRKHKSNWSKPKKVLITISVAIGLIVAMSIGIGYYIFMYTEFPDLFEVPSRGGQAISIEDVNSQLNISEYAEISEAELVEYPELNIRTGTYNYLINRTEWERTKNFLDKKWLKRSNQFVINETDLEEELNKSIVTAKMRDTFGSKGYTIPEKSYIKQDGDKWYVITRLNLFGITDSEVEKELNKINITTGKDTGDIVPTKLRNTFASNGFSLPDDSKVSREDGEWVIKARTGYTILNEVGKLNVYADDEKTYEIYKEDGKLKIVYISTRGNPIYKIREKYFKFIFLQF